MTGQKSLNDYGGSKRFGISEIGLSNRALGYLLGNKRIGEIAAIFTSHGVLDAATTILAARAVGPTAEANPVVRELLAMGELPAAVAMLAVVGLCCGAWPVAADTLETPEWVGLGIATIGAAIAAVNLVVFA